MGIGPQRSWPIGSSLSSRPGRRADQPRVDLRVAAGMLHGRADAIEPGALVRCLRRGERRARELLGIQAVVDLLRRVAADRQGAGSASVSNELPKPDM